MFMAQHMTYYLSALSPRIISISTLEHLLRTMKPWAPIATIIVEALMGGTITIGRLVHSRFWTRTGLMMILYFHLLICLTPKPNDISNFGLICGSRLIVLLEPQSLEITVQQYVRPFIFYISLLVIPIVAYGIQNSFTPLNWAFLLYITVLILCQIAVHVESNQQHQPNTTPRETKNVHDDDDDDDDSDVSFTRPSWTHIPPIFAAFYAFGSLIFGLQEEATPNMVRIFFNFFFSCRFSLRIGEAIAVFTYTSFRIL
jgi:hypothetical protein